MTKYRLKNQDLQRHLDAISNGAFSECLKANLHFFEDGVTRINFGKNFGYASQFSVLILKDEFEALPEYNPNDWNVFPDVTPPEGVWMRTEHRDETDPPGIIRKVGAVFQDGAWRNSTGEAYPSYISIKRFRPWE